MVMVLNTKGTVRKACSEQHFQVVRVSDLSHSARDSHPCYCPNILFSLLLVLSIMSILFLSFSAPLLIITLRRHDLVRSFTVSKELLKLNTKATAYSNFLSKNTNPKTTTLVVFRPIVNSCLSLSLDNVDLPLHVEWLLVRVFSFKDDVVSPTRTLSFMNRPSIPGIVIGENVLQVNHHLFQAHLGSVFPARTLKVWIEIRDSYIEEDLDIEIFAIGTFDMGIFAMNVAHEQEISRNGRVVA